MNETNSIHLLSILYGILYCPSQRKGNYGKKIWKFGNVDDGSIKLRPQLPVCFGFTIVILASNSIER